MGTESLSFNGAGILAGLCFSLCGARICPQSSDGAPRSRPPPMARYREIHEENAVIVV